MPSSSGPIIPESNLVFAFDVGDVRNSYLGEPATNTLPNPSINALPTYGNGWATYNTNQYCGNNGCGNFWDMPAIAEISDNIVTTVSNHTVRSFDVLRPQTSGGGVIANTDYLMKKISDTRFSLHAYNSSQDGSQGYINPITNGHKVHDSYWLDQRIEVSDPGGFPTRWWGYPHLPNSGLVKEIIPNGFDYLGHPKTNCMRFHAHRPDGVADGMAYGVDATVVPGQVHTYSFWTRAINAAAAGAGTSMSNYNYGSVSPTSWGHSYTLGPVGVWQRQSFQFTPINEYIISYFWPGGGQVYDIANIQVERNTHPTPFTTGSRSLTTSLLDLTGRTTINLNTASFDSVGQPILDGTDDRIDLGNVSDYFSSGVRAITVEAVFKITPGASGPPGPILENYRYNLWYSYGDDIVSCTTRSGPPDTAGYQFAVNMNATVACNSKGSYNHVVAVYETLSSTTGRIKMYVNGQFAGTTTGVKMGAYPLTDTWIGQSSHSGYGTYKLNGRVDIIKVYTAALSEAEILENYRNLKTRFGI
jgi:hypothetical protein